MLLVFTRETPKYLLQKAQRRAAERGIYSIRNICILYILIFLAIKWFRCENNSEVIEAELQELEMEVEHLRTNSIKVQ